MYGMFKYTWLIFMVNVGKYAIHDMDCLGYVGGCYLKTTYKNKRLTHWLTRFLLMEHFKVRTSCPPKTKSRNRGHYMTSTQKLFSGNPSKWRLQHLHQVWSLQNGNPLVKEHGTLKWTSWRCIPYKNGEFTIAMLVYWSVIHSKRPLRKSTQYGVEKIDSHLCALCLTFIAGTMKDFFILTCFDIS